MTYLSNIQNGCASALQTYNDRGGFWWGLLGFFAGLITGLIPVIIMNFCMKKHWSENMRSMLVGAIFSTVGLFAAGILGFCVWAFVLCI